jgi:hypothetical protein
VGSSCCAVAPRDVEGPGVFYSTLRQYAGGYSSHRGMSGYGGNTQIYYTVLVAVEGHTADWNIGSSRAAQVGGSEPVA